MSEGREKSLIRARLNQAKMLKKQYSKSKPVCKVTFSLPVEAVEGGAEVRVVGDFNDWNWEQGFVMTVKKGEYSASADLASGRDYEFRYLVDNERWVNDWAADGYLPSPYFGTDNSVLSLQESAPAQAGVAEAAPSEAAAPKKTRTTKTAKG